ncbi:MAG: type II toxin-antitoxin system HipA family toxin [Planctomycetes bacterium]|nr:type II toxin-antitoxin system HipA family toxin [Planctomycetota bacterium]MBT7318348.1 type II toxin-antitoxin system HipA family toxin [Planctomycetota bacterium]
MSRPSRLRRLSVWMNGIHVGEWSIAVRGRHEFAYATTWLDSPLAVPLSHSLPLGDSGEVFRGDLVERYFRNLLPDSDSLLRRVQSQFQTDSISAFSLLAEIGRDCVGAVQLLPLGEQPKSTKSIQAQPLDEAQVANAMRHASSSPQLGQGRPRHFRISLAGAQDKTALLWHDSQWCLPHGFTPTTHIFKLPLGRVGHEQVDLSTSIENEWLCMQLVRAFGLRAPNCQMLRFQDQRAFVVERFDRQLVKGARWWERLPQEDFCQALGVSSNQKYESNGGPGMVDGFRFLRASLQAEQDGRDFLKAQILYWMLAAPDGHAKNFSVFIKPGGFSLTPFYDVISAHPFLGHGRNQVPTQQLTMAMSLRGKNKHYRWAEMQPRHWVSTLQSCGMQNEWQAVCHDMLARVDSAISSVEKKIPADFPEAVRDLIFAGLQSAGKKLS